MVKVKKQCGEETTQLAADDSFCNSIRNFAEMTASKEKREEAAFTIMRQSALTNEIRENG